MSYIRQTEAFRTRGLAETFRGGHRLDLHTHPWGQLVYAVSGVMRVATPDATWLVPPTRAIWAPAGTPHEIEMRGTVAMRTLYLSPADHDARLAACRAIEVTPLLRELILHIVRIGVLDPGDPGHTRIEGLLADLVAAGETAPLELPLPGDPRARRMAERILASAGPGIPLADLARDSGASLRTLQRIFQKETRLTLEAWRGRARMQKAVAALGLGASVTQAALEAGYQSPSAFVSAFRRAFEMTPARYARRFG